MKVYPIQSSHLLEREHLGVNEAVYLKAYEVYCELYGEQPALVDHTRGCRGGFGVGELVAFLYAGCAPKDKWRERFHEALEEMTL